MHAKRLEHFGSPAGEYERNMYSNGERHTVADTLRDFPSIADPSVPLDVLIDIIPRLQVPWIPSPAPRAAHHTSHQKTSPISPPATASLGR